MKKIDEINRKKGEKKGMCQKYIKLQMLKKIQVRIEKKLL